ncbi:MAG: hypothetical protein ACM3WU_02730 [Bacillota bacterium]
MPRKIGILVFAIVVFAASFAVEWAGTGGLGEPLDLSDSRVTAASQHLKQPISATSEAGGRTLLNAWLTEANGGYKVNLGYKSPTGYWLTTVQFDEGGSFVKEQTKLWSGKALPAYLRRLSYIFAALWPIVAFVWPHFFAVKCPDCRSSFFSPILAEVQEATVYGGGFDKDGHDLSPIVRRDYVCPKCGYRKITYHVDPRHSGGSGKTRPIKQSMAAGLDLNPKELDWYEKVVGKYLTDHEGGKGLRFPTYDDWKAFFDELKATEREERSGAPA